MSMEAQESFYITLFGLPLLKQQQHKKHVEFVRRMSSSLYHYFVTNFLLCEEVYVSNSRDFKNTSVVTLLSV